ncbi:precorrin-2 dehydrogenase/sirohydrochlorin ferrochelatase family protein [Thermodesulfovibrio yellowstonii]|uniref:precorrin-2 dehydrogenase n=1 Tax=Thermodesulfovibrio yellowstonii (strain ATCC 51303 / DSM 11347 / YP87) TaxID=289376 RepID=B5YKA6_THEYD|nr:bifunctional precorrin-2 dehydrogenase/sirohydrochlorin ferrochelatase [Thermodesulfovibrio yellowstonii]ACI22057.1 siroheme synthase [Thermodesulfovibrio yellowstonii DSM 11347]
MAKLFPILADIKGKKCVVIGGGTVAERKIKALLKYGANITLISPEISNNLKEIVQKGKIDYIKTEYKKENIKDAFLVIAATSNEKLNAQITKDAKFLVNCVSGQSNLNTNGLLYNVPAILHKGDLTIAVSTEFPALSRIIRDEISKLYGREFALYLKYLKKLRKEIQKTIPDIKRRQTIFRKIASKKIVSILKQYGFKEAKKEIEKIIDEV